MPLALGHPLPLAIRSCGVEWKGGTYYLVRLDSIQFSLEKTNHLKAAIQAEVTTFDEVDYEISCAVFDAAGQMLGAARAQCNVPRTWIGTVLHGARTINLDFGISLDYARAIGFMISISNRRVLTPDTWQK